MTTLWAQPVGVLIEQADPGWEGIWALTFAAGHAAINLSLAVPLGLSVELTYAANERVRGFSAGMERRLSVARLLLSRPRLLLLDEPYSNLDAAGIAMMSELISESVRAGGAALVVLHELAPAAGILSRTVTIQDGRC